MIFKSSSVLNFAHGELMAIGAFLFLALSAWADLPIILAFVLTLAGSFTLGFILEKFFLRPLIGEALIQVIMLTLGLALMFRGLLLFIFGGGYPRFTPNFFARSSFFKVGSYSDSICVRGSIHNRDTVPYPVRALLQIFITGNLHEIRG